MSWLFDPLSLDFMREALLISVLIAAAMGALSCLLVLKGWSLMGDAISHAVLPGVVLAYLLGLPLVMGAFVAGMGCAVATGFVAERSRVKPDAVMGVVFSGMFALGVVLHTRIRTEVHLDHILFGHMLGIGWADIVQTGAISLIVLGFVLVLRRDLLVFAFDPQHARAIGLATGWLHYGMLAMVSLSVVGALAAVGLILAIALLIAPGAIAYLLTRRFGAMLWMSILIAVIAAYLGIALSLKIGSDPAASIVLMLLAAFVLAFLFGPNGGRVWVRAGLLRTE